MVEVDCINQDQKAVPLLLPGTHFALCVMLEDQASLVLLYQHEEKKTGSAGGQSKYIQDCVFDFRNKWQR